MKLIKFPVFVICFGLALSAQAADRRKTEEAPAPPPFRVDVATRPMAMQKIVINVPTGSPIGQYADTCSKIFGGGPSIPIYSDHAFRGVPPRDYMSAFSAEAGAAGYRVANAQGGGDLFTTESGAAAELVVGAAVLSIKAEGCPDIGFTTTYTMDTTIAIDWQVFDPLEKKIIYRATKDGHAQVTNKISFERITLEGARAAYISSIKALLSDPEFVAAVKDTRGGAPADPGSLFPEANTSSAVPATNAATTVQIARLPQNTKAFREQVEDLRRHVVTIESAAGTGSGFYIADGLLLTNEHVVRGARTLRARFFGGKQIPAEVVATDARRDIALVKTESVSLPGLPLHLEKPELSAPVFVIGSPLGSDNEGSVITGIVSAFRDSPRGPFIQSDVPVTHGNSGGPMFDEKGNVIGLVDIGKHGDDGVAVAINLFIPIGDGLKTLGIDFTPGATATKATTSR